MTSLSPEPPHHVDLNPEAQDNLPSPLELLLNLGERTFRTVSNSETGEVSGKTLFSYKQIGRDVTVTYAGGDVRNGHMVGVIREDGILESLYHHINVKDELKSGRCEATPGILPDGRLYLREKWQWTVGGTEHGDSIVEEVTKDEFQRLKTQGQ